uniref:Uncharacterized protein n=1 Tax=Populus alba TaxID=43335 RepID=A0A4U5QWI7_POPAL|nr:hypothetical protein D5086_0000037580 [Populus alba]
MGKEGPKGLGVPGDFPKPPSNELPEISSEHQIHDSEWIVKMRAACELAAHVLENAGCFQLSYACHAGRIIFWKANFYPSIHDNKFLQLSWNSQSKFSNFHALKWIVLLLYALKPSVTTNEIDKAVCQMIIDDGDTGAYPSPLGYGGFQNRLCTSVNESMCHGIPNSRQLQTLQKHFCGNVSDGIKRLVKGTEECLERGIDVCKDGASFKKIGKRISSKELKMEFFVYGSVFTSALSIEPITQEAMRVMGSSSSLSSLLYEPAMTDLVPWLKVKHFTIDNSPRDARVLLSFSQACIVIMISGHGFYWLARRSQALSNLVTVTVLK